MAAVRYRSEWTDNNGDDWRIDIIDQGYSGSIQETYILQADGCNLNWAGQTKAKFSPILTSELTIGLVIRDAGEQALLTQIASHPEGEFLVGLYKESSGTYSLWWSGVIMTDQIQFTESAYPRQVELTATDDVGNLTELPYDNDGTAYSGAQSTVIDNMRLALRKTRQASYFYGDDDAFLYYANDFTPNNEDASVINHLNSAKIPWSTFQIPQQNGLIKTVSTYQVMESICISYNARLFQYQGVWYVLPLGGYLDEDNDWAYRIMDYDGGSGGSSTGVSKSTVLGTDYQALADMTIAYFQPFKQTIRRQLYYGAAPLMWDAVYPLRTSPTVVDQDLDYASSFELRVTANARTIKLPQGNASGGDRVGRFLFKITVKVGDLYAHRAATFSNQGAYFFDWNNGFQYSYETPTYDDFTWSTSEGQIWVVSDTFNVYNGTGGSFTTNIDLTTAGLTADKEGAEMSCELYFLDRSGNLTLIDDDNDAGYTFLNLHNFAARNSGEDGLLSDGVQWSSEGDASNRGDLNTGEVILGDLVSDGARGVIQVQTGASTYAASTGWRNSQHTTGTLGIHQLGTQEMQKIHDQVGTGMAGSVVGQMPSPTELIETSEGDKHLVIGLQANLTKGITDIECTRLIRGGTIVVGDGDDFAVAVDDGGWGTSADDNSGGQPPIGFGQGELVLSVNGSKGTVTLDADDISDAATTNKFSTAGQLAKVDHLTVTAGTDLDTMRGDVTTNNAKVGKTADDTSKLGTLTLNSGGTALTNIGLEGEVIRATNIETNASRSFATTTQLNSIASNTLSITSNTSSISDIEDKTDLITITAQHNLDTTKDKVGHIQIDGTNGITGLTVKAGSTPLTADEVSASGTTNKFMTQAEKNKLGYLTVTDATNLNTHRQKLSYVGATAQGINSLTLIGQPVGADKVDDSTSTNKFTDADGVQALGHLTSDATGITQITVSDTIDLDTSDVGAFFAGGSGGTNNRSGVSNKRILLLGSDGGMEEQSAGKTGQILVSGGNTGDPTWEDDVTVIAAASGRVSSQYTNSYYYGSSSYGWNYPIWSSITFNNTSGNPYARNVSDDYAHCGIICPVAFRKVTLTGTIRNDSSTDDLSVFLGKVNPPNGSSSNMVLTEMGTDAVSITTQDLHYDFEIIDTSGVSAGQLLFVGFARTAGTSTTRYLNFSFTIHGAK